MEHKKMLEYNSKNNFKIKITYANHTPYCIGNFNISEAGSRKRYIIYQMIKNKINKRY